MQLLLPLAQSSGNTAAGAGVGAFLILWILISLAVFIFWIWMLIDVLGSNMPTSEKLLWGLVVFFLPLIGSLIYFFVRRGSTRTV